MFQIVYSNCRSFFLRGHITAPDCWQCLYNATTFEKVSFNKKDWNKKYGSNHLTYTIPLSCVPSEGLGSAHHSNHKVRTNPLNNFYKSLIYFYFHLQSGQDRKSEHRALWSECHGSSLQKLDRICFAKTSLYDRAYAKKIIHNLWIWYNQNGKMIQPKRCTHCTHLHNNVN